MMVSRLLLSMLLCLVAMGSTAQQQLQLSAEQIQALEIELYGVDRLAHELSDPVPARLVLNDKYQRILTLPISGTVQQLIQLPGAAVAAGDGLCLIHSREALALQRQYLAANDQIERSDAAKQRDQALYEGGVVSKKRWQQTLEQWGQTQALVGELASQLTAIGFNDAELEQLRRERKIRDLLPLRAPVKGVILERKVSSGEAFSAGQKLYHIGDPEQLWLSIQAPPSLALRAQAGDQVYHRSQPLGRLLQVGAAVDSRSRSVLLTAELTQPAPDLLPGQSLMLQLLFQARQGLWLPRNSVVSIAGETAVFVATNDGYAVRPVQVVPALDGWAVLTGLSAGEQVAATGSAALKGVVMGLGVDGDAQ